MFSQDWLGSRQKLINRFLVFSQDWRGLQLKPDQSVLNVFAGFAMAALIV